MPLPVNDATTVLNPGVGGDTMDESTVNQTAVNGTVTATKRARVVIGFDDGSLLGYDGDMGLGKNLKTHDDETHDALAKILYQMKVQTGLLKLIADALGASDLELDTLAELGNTD